MLEVGTKVSINHILRKAIFDSGGLPIRLKNSLDKLKKFHANPAEITKIETVDEGIVIYLKVAESYSSSSVPAVMCEAYSSGRGDPYFFENVSQAEIIFSEENPIPLLNLSTEKIQASQLVRLVYASKLLVITPATNVRDVSDYHGIIGRSVGLIEPNQYGSVQLLEITQLMDNKSFHDLTIRGRRAR